MRFKITGARKDSGEDIELTVNAMNKLQAEQLANSFGILVSTVDLISDKKCDSVQVGEREFSFIFFKNFILIAITTFWGVLLGCIVGFFSAHYFPVFGGFLMLGEPDSEWRNQLVPGHMLLFSFLLGIVGFVLGLGIAGFIFGFFRKKKHIDNKLVCANNKSDDTVAGKKKL